MPVDSKIAFCEFCVIWAGQDGDVYKENEAKEYAAAAAENEANLVENDNDQEDTEEKELNRATDNPKINEESHLPPKIHRQSHNSVQEDKGEKESGRIPLPWELLQPVLRILGHCLMGPNKNKELYEAACAACRSLYARSLHDINSRAILATGSLLRLVKMNSDAIEEIDHTDITDANVISL